MNECLQPFSVAHRPAGVLIRNLDAGLSASRSLPNGVKVKRARAEASEGEEFD